MSASDTYLSQDDQPTLVYLRRGDKYTPRGIDWVWRHYLARGKLHLLAGPAGIQKTTCALSIVALLTSATSMPDGSKAHEQVS